MKEETLDKIDRYLRDEMTDEEKRSFEKILKGDTSLRENVELSKDIVNRIVRNEQMREQMLKWDKKIEEKKAINKVRKKIILVIGAVGIAACLLFGWFVGGTFHYMIDEPSSSHTKNEYYFRGSFFDFEVRKLLEQKRYDKALILIDSLEKQCRQEIYLYSQKDTLTEEQAYELTTDSLAIYELGWLRIEVLTNTKEIEQAEILLEEYRTQDGKYKEKADSLWNILRKRR